MVKRVIIAVGYFSMNVLHFSRSARKMEYKRYIIFLSLFVFRAPRAKNEQQKMGKYHAAAGKAMFERATA
jgi:hypothetical protein